MGIGRSRDREPNAGAFFRSVLQGAFIGGVEHPGNFALPPILGSIPIKIPSSPPGEFESHVQIDGDNQTDGDNRGVNLEPGGWEEIAFYLPWTYGHETWGIYFRAGPFLRLAQTLQHEMQAGGLSKSLEWTMWACLRCLWEHELFHFGVELASAYAQSLFPAVRLANMTSESVKLSEAEMTIVGGYYENYMWRHYRPSFGSIACIEESLATAQQVYAAKSIDREFGKLIERFSYACPPGYKDFGRFVGDTRQRRGKARLLSLLFNGKVRSGELLSTQLSVPYSSSIPTYWLPDSKSMPPDGWLLHLVTLPLHKVLRDAGNRGANITQGGRHPICIEIGGRKVPLKKWSDDRVPRHVVKQLADMYGVSPNTYCMDVAGR